VATGHPFAADIVRAAKRPVTYVNDCRALTLSEAVFGAGRGLSPVVGLIIGTGIGGGVAVDGRLLAGPGHLGGEFGHTHAPAHLVVAHDLPVIRCGCGRMGCTETYIAGPGLSRIALKFTGRPMSPPDLLAARATDPMAAQVWDIWCQFVAELLMTLTLTVDPACIVLGGGLSKAPDVIDDLTSALRAAQWPGYSVPKIMLAQGGETSGARGAAYAATLAAMEVVHV
jgi:N-acetylglucosamine kinase